MASGCLLKVIVVFSLGFVALGLRIQGVIFLNFGALKWGCFCKALKTTFLTLLVWKPFFFVCFLCDIIAIFEDGFEDSLGLSRGSGCMDFFEGQVLAGADSLIMSTLCLF